MALVLKNEEMGAGMFLMVTDQGGGAQPGQFYMVRSWDKYPLLSRPVSIFHQDEETTSFLYRVVGEGTELLSRCKPGDPVDLQGPYGTGFPMVTGKRIAMVGGGIGTAPLYWTAQALKELDGDNEVTLYLGFDEENQATDLFKNLDADLHVQIGGYVTDGLESEEYDLVYTCGPEIMMKKVYEFYRETCKDVYVSMEKRMACGVGACLGCTCETKDGNKRTCKEGPVFPGRSVFYE
ncbi:dihydroorotate dehydrogenase electron transfer subunit [Alkalibacter rhizosphaerae]|uniref:Dihydroorotate dehydrogenase electron transfer subunit n=1 Tax=Alkalibacter rhizosphaerae TaxID=2815577 RepID=A0A974XDC3_9FIRM|nr:dihydroorotate dehydrogenase electron transfer subunit [Alkalibacter rhizosphaerae]QSX07757.1 dihydroorotate dehydrogenase electron transfer subunit [Alkalibacter rhizosphaerae]